MIKTFVNYLSVFPFAAGDLGIGNAIAVQKGHIECSFEERDVVGNGDVAEGRAVKLLNGTKKLVFEIALGDFANASHYSAVIFASVDSFAGRCLEG